MQAFLGRVAERSDAVLDSSQRTYASARISAIALLSTALLLAALCWAFIRRGVLLPLREAGMHFDRIAGGDLTSRVETRSNNEIGALFAALKRMQEGLTRTVSTVRQGVDEINIGSAEIAAGNANLSSRTEEQAAALEQTAATMEQLAATVKQNADNAAQANQLAAVSMEVAQRGGQTVGQVVQTMQGISDSSKRIADIVSVIDGIAFQTNILALNAAVEAARAANRARASRSSPAKSARWPSGRLRQQGNQDPDRNLGGHRGVGLGPRHGRRPDHAGNRDLGAARGRHHGRNLGGLGRAGRRHRPDHPGGIADGRGDAAERRAGGRGLGRRLGHGGPGAQAGRGHGGVQDPVGSGDRGRTGGRPGPWRRATRLSRPEPGRPDRAGRSTPGPAGLISCDAARRTG